MDDGERLVKNDFKTFFDHEAAAGLVLMAVAIAALLAVNLAGVTRGAGYVLIGIALWVCVLKSGVHATLAGVACALAIPLRKRNAAGESPLL